MTTLNNDELRARIFPNWRYSKPKGHRMGLWRKSRPGFLQNEMTEAEMRNIMKRVATHDQQLLEAILAGIVDVDDTRGDTQNGNNPKYWTRRTKVINERNEEIRQHIKSVFEGRK